MKLSGLVLVLSSCLVLISALPSSPTFPGALSVPDSVKSQLSKIATTAKDRLIEITPLEDEDFKVVLDRVGNAQAVQSPTETVETTPTTPTTQVITAWQTVVTPSATLGVAATPDVRDSQVLSPKATQVSAGIDSYINAEPEGEAHFAVSTTQSKDLWYPWMTRFVPRKDPFTGLTHWDLGWKWYKRLIKSVKGKRHCARSVVHVMNRKGLESLAKLLLKQSKGEPVKIGVYYQK